MSNRILVFYGSYRSDRMGIHLAEFVVERLRRRGDNVELIDAKAINLPMLDRMYKEYPKGNAPAALEQLAQKIRVAVLIQRSMELLHSHKGGYHEH
jgi:NAD(P)H-dependent FMN reductase